MKASSVGTLASVTNKVAAVKTFVEQGAFAAVRTGLHKMTRNVRNVEKMATATTICINAICRHKNLLLHPLLQPEHGVNGRLTIQNATATKTWCTLTAKQSAKHRQWPMVTAGTPSATTLRTMVDTSAFHLPIVTMVS